MRIVQLKPSIDMRPKFRYTDQPHVHFPVQDQTALTFKTGRFPRRARFTSSYSLREDWASTSTVKGARCFHGESMLVGRTERTWRIVSKNPTERKTREKKHDDHGQDQKGRKRKQFQQRHRRDRKGGPVVARPTETSKPRRLNFEAIPACRDGDWSGRDWRLRIVDSDLKIQTGFVLDPCISSVRNPLRL